MEKEFSWKKGKLEQPVLKRNKLPYTPWHLAINFFGMLLRNDARRVYNYQTRTAPEVVLNRRVQLEKDDPYSRPFTKALMEGWVDIRYKQSKANQGFDVSDGTGKRILEFYLNPEIVKNRRMELTLRTIAKHYQEWFNKQYEIEESKEDPRISKYIKLLSPSVGIDLTTLQGIVSNIPKSVQNLVQKYADKNTNKKTGLITKPKPIKRGKPPKLWFDIYAVKELKPNGKFKFERRRVQGYTSFCTALNAIKNKPVDKLYQALPKIVESKIEVASVLNFYIKERNDGTKTIFEAYIPSNNQEEKIGSVYIRNSTIYSLWVEPKYRNYGVASSLMKHMIKTIDVKRIEPSPFNKSPITGETIESPLNKEDLISFYKKFGFKEKEGSDFLYKQDEPIEESGIGPGIPVTNKQSMNMPTNIPINTQI